MKYAQTSEQAGLKEFDLQEKEAYLQRSTRKRISQTGEEGR
jgi:hypothetical protein